MAHRILVVLLLAVAFALDSCASPEPESHYGFVARLGTDTVSVENVTWRGQHVIVDGVDRFPRVRRRHTSIDLGDNGGILRLTMDIETPSEPADERERHVEASVSGDRVHLVKTDRADTVRRDFNTRNAVVVAHVPQMYSLYDIYFVAAHRNATSGSTDDTVHLRQFYIDREFDDFSMHNASVRLLPNDHAEIWHDWLAGIGEAQLDSSGHLVRYSGARTTYKVDVVRTPDTANVNAIAQSFAAAEAKNGGARELSVRDTARAMIGNETLMIDYSRPLRRGRMLLGNIIPYDRVWRTGANAATQFSTSAAITIGDLHVPAGTYTLWTVPRRNGAAELIVNRQTRQWGTQYNPSLDLGRMTLHTKTVPQPVEKFTIAIVPNGANRAILRLAWGTFQWTAPIALATGAGR